MDFHEYVSRIQFRFIQPETRILPLGFDRIMQRLKIGPWFEMVNTELPEHHDEMKSRLQDVCFIPKMSTFAIGAMINKAVRQMNPEHAFVNVGVWRGFTFLSGLVGNEDKTCIGVDNFSEFGNPKSDFLDQFEQYKSPNHHFHEMGYEDYFEHVHDAPIGVFIYDGNHSYENQLQALQIAEPYFADDCIIVVDDVNYDDVHQANQDFMTNSPHPYQTILHQETFCNNHPTFWNGITVMKRTTIQ